jgi:hypothetical protein
MHNSDSHLLKHFMAARKNFNYLKFFLEHTEYRTYLILFRQTSFGHLFLYI